MVPEWSPIAGAFVDPAGPLDWSHPLNRGLVGEWAVLPNPGWRGGPAWRDLTRPNRKPADLALTGFASPAAGWAGPRGRPGGYGSVLFANNGSDYATGTLRAAVTVPLTVAGWFNPLRLSDTDGFPCFFYAAGGALLYISGSDLRWQRQNGGFESCVATPPADIAVGRWAFLTVVHRGTGAGQAEVYCNGLRLADDGTAVSALSTATFQVAQPAEGGTGNFFGGYADGVALYNRGLSAAEVYGLYQETRAGNPGRWRWAGLRAYSSPEDAGGGTFTAAGALVTGSATASGSATFAAGTKTASGALSAGPATAAGSATFTAPTYTAAGTLSAGSATASGAATFAAGTKTATGALAAGSATASGSATFAPGTKTASGAVAAAAATAAGSATFAEGTRTASGAVSTTAATAAGSAAFTAPAYTGAGAVNAQPATAAGSAVSATAVFQASGALVAGPAAAAGSAAHTPPTYSGAGSLNAATAAAAGSAATTPPAFTGAGAWVAANTLLSGSASFAAGARTATAALNVTAATAAGLGIFTPGPGPVFVPGDWPTVRVRRQDRTVRVPFGGPAAESWRALRG